MGEMNIKDNIKETDMIAVGCKGKGKSFGNAINIKAEITEYAEKIAELTTLMADVMCLSEDLANMDITKKIKDEIDYQNSELFHLIASLYAKKANDRMNIDLDNRSVQEAQNLINEFNCYCEENNWFGE